MPLRGVLVPYRTPALAAKRDEAVPLWVRALARVLCEFPCMREFRSVRRAAGGRWSYVVEHVRDAGCYNQRVSWRWMRASECQGLAHSGWLSRGEIPHDACYDSSALNLMADEACGYFEHTERQCNCEVWP